MTERRTGLPPVGQGIANWYETPLPLFRECLDCGEKEHQSPAVLEYLADLDPGGYEAREKHPGWERTGWLVWWHCSQCGADTNAVVAVEQVAQWGQALGGWRPVL